MRFKRDLTDLKLRLTRKLLKPVIELTCYMPLLHQSKIESGLPFKILTLHMQT